MTKFISASQDIQIKKIYLLDSQAEPISELSRSWKFHYRFNRMTIPLKLELVAKGPGQFDIVIDKLEKSIKSFKSFNN